MVVTEGKNIVINNIKDFDLSQTLECGQCFRYDRLGDNEYIIVAHEKMLRLCQDGSMLILYDTDYEEYENIWREYFDLDRDYHSIKQYLLEYDDRLSDAINSKSGVRILRQDFFEILISFIISQNKQIPHIMKIVETLSGRYGKKIGEYNGKEYYSFPTKEELSKVTLEEFKDCKTGFRAKYLVDAVCKVVNGQISEEKLRNMTTKQIDEQLQTIKGVGSKVANCVLLFGLDRREAFPVDVWMKRIMERLYFDGDTKKEIIQTFAYEHFGEYGGYAQQYLFYYARDGVE